MAALGPLAPFYRQGEAQGDRATCPEASGAKGSRAACAGAAQHPPAAAGREALTPRSLSTSAGIPLCPLPLADPGPSPPHTPPPLPLRPLPLSSCSVFFPLCWPVFQLTGDAAKRGERTTCLRRG